jgi:hypothetical protein
MGMGHSAFFGVGLALPLTPSVGTGMIRQRSGVILDEKYP